MSSPLHHNSREHAPPLLRDKSHEQVSVPSSRHASHLLLGNPHVVADVREHSGRDEIALVAVPVAADLQLGPLRLAAVDQRHNLAELLLVHLARDTKLRSDEYFSQSR